MPQDFADNDVERGSGSRQEMTPFLSDDHDDKTDLQGDKETVQSHIPSPPQTRPLFDAIHPAVFVANWIFWSTSTILYNKWILEGFRYPIIITCWHMTFAAGVTQLLARFTPFLNSRNAVKITGRIYLKAIVPIGVLYSFSLVCSNIPYLYLSVPFIQMLKGTAPVFVLVATWCLGLTKPDRTVFFNMIVIVIGGAIASFGEIKFHVIGFLFQVGALFFEAFRLAFIQRILNSPDFRMDPLVSLYYYGPVCAVMTALAAFVFELPHFEFADIGKIGLLTLIGNAVVAFLLNVASVCLIGKTSSLVLTLCGTLKNLIIILSSLIIFSTPDNAAVVTPMQSFGYGITIAGLLWYNMGKKAVTEKIETAFGWIFENRGGNLGSGSGGRRKVRRSVIYTGALVGVGLVVIFVPQVLEWLWPLKAKLMWSIGDGDGEGAGDDMSLVTATGGGESGF